MAKLSRKKTSTKLLILFRFDVRGKSYAEASHKPNVDILGYRAHFLVEKELARLSIHEVKDEDAGMYMCRVDFRKSQTQYSKINLTVDSK